MCDLKGLASFFANSDSRRDLLLCFSVRRTYAVASSSSSSEWRVHCSVFVVSHSLFSLRIELVLYTTRLEIFRDFFLD